MAEAAPAARAPRMSRLDRRKARTRQALTDAAVRLIPEGRGDRASIAEITGEAAIRFGAFYNRFGGLEQLFHAAGEQVLERGGARRGCCCASPIRASRAVLHGPAGMPGGGFRSVWLRHERG